MIIDFHVHCFPDGLAKKAVTSLSKVGGIAPWVDGSINDIKKSMKKAGINKSVILSIATKPEQADSISQWSEIIQDDSIIAFGSIHPESDNWKNELIRLKEMNIKGIKLHPEYQQFYVDDEKMFPIYQKAFELGFIIVFHTGIDLGLPGPCHCTPPMLKNMLKTFQGGKIVAAHMGGYQCWDKVEEYLAGEDIYFDTSYSIEEMGLDQFNRLLKNHGYKKILFGTDSPWSGQAEELKRFRSYGLPDDIQRAILGENAAKLLQI